MTKFVNQELISIMVGEDVVYWDKKEKHIEYMTIKSNHVLKMTFQALINNIKDYVLKYTDKISLEYQKDKVNIFVQDSKNTYFITKNTELDAFIELGQQFVFSKGYGSNFLQSNYKINTNI